MIIYKYMYTYIYIYTYCVCVCDIIFNLMDGRLVVPHMLQLYTFGKHIHETGFEEILSPIEPIIGVPLNHPFLDGNFPWKPSI